MSADNIDNQNDATVIVHQSIENVNPFNDDNLDNFGALIDDQLLNDEIQGTQYLGEDTRFVNQIHNIVNRQNAEVKFFNNLDTKKTNRNKIEKLKVNRLIDRNIIDLDNSLCKKGYKKLLMHNDNGYNPHDLSNSIDIEDEKKDKFLKMDYGYENFLKNAKISKLKFENRRLDQPLKDNDNRSISNVSNISVYKKKLENEEEKLKRKLAIVQAKIKEMKQFLKKTEKFKLKPEWKKINTFQKKEKNKNYFHKKILDDLSSSNRRHANNLPM